MRQVDAIEATTTFGDLLRLAQAGEEVAITAQGRVVARLLPPLAGIGHEPARDLAQQVRDMSKGVTLGDGLTTRDLVREGRR